MWMNFGSQQSIKQKWHSLECPHCKSLFRVHQQDLIPIDYYEFSCLSCHQFFWSALNRENQRINIWTVKPQKTHSHSPLNEIDEKPVNDEKICPHCLKTMKRGDFECHQCGVSFYDPRWIQRAPLASFGLRKNYEKLLQNFDSSTEHDRFTLKCVRENNIAFGAYCYGQFLKSKPDNPYSKKKLKYFEAVLLPFVKKEKTKLKAYSYYFNYRTGWIHSVLLFTFITSIALLYIAYKMVPLLNK